jgi:hypothetical protein
VAKRLFSKKSGLKVTYFAIKSGAILMVLKEIF